MKGLSTPTRMLIVLAILIVGAVITYRYLLSPGTRQQLNLVVAASGLPVTPWPDRAEAVVRAICEADGSNIAQAVLAATHPTGENPTLSSTSFSREGETLTCAIQVSWSGGLLGTPYLTSIVWKLGEQGHVSVRVASDSAQITASPSAPSLLESYFAKKVWPAVARSMGS